MTCRHVHSEAGGLQGVCPGWESWGPPLSSPYDSYRPENQIDRVSQQNRLSKFLTCLCICNLLKEAPGMVWGGSCPSSLLCGHGGFLCPLGILRLGGHAVVFHQGDWETEALSTSAQPPRCSRSTCQALFGPLQPALSVPEDFLFVCLDTKPFSLTCAHYGIIRHTQEEKVK